MITVKFIVSGIECELDLLPNTKVSDAMWEARVATDYTETNGERGWQLLTQSGDWCGLDEPISNYTHDMPLNLVLKAGTGA
jgi:hypothetical protein